MASTSRPEHSGPPELFYNESEAVKYTANSHIIKVQAELTERALELLVLPDDTPCFLLDIGCGSGLSGEVLSDSGHQWIGLDISAHMLAVAADRDDDCSGDNLLLHDMGLVPVPDPAKFWDCPLGLPFRPGCFDGSISISALQWLCHANTNEQMPKKRLYRFFSSLYAALSRGSRAVFQFYPENNAQVQLITEQATRAGFTGGLVVDYPNSTRAKKVYLVLFTGGAAALPPALGTGTAAQQTSIRVARRQRIAAAAGAPAKGTRQWVLAKKERDRRRNKEVRVDSKYTGRKRNGRF